MGITVKLQGFCLRALMIGLSCLFSTACNLQQGSVDQSSTLSASENKTSTTNVTNESAKFSEYNNASLSLLSDENVVDMLLHDGIGSCYILDSSISCPTCFCAHYFKSKTVSWSGKGWPISPSSHDGSGCISTTQWAGYTSEMATLDWIHNAAAQARNAFADPTNPCQITQPIAATPTPVPENSNSPMIEVMPTSTPQNPTVYNGQGCSMIAIFVGINGNDPFNMAGDSSISFDDCQKRYANTSIDPNYLSITKSACKDMTNYLGGPVQYSFYMGWNGAQQPTTNHVIYYCDSNDSTAESADSKLADSTQAYCTATQTSGSYVYGIPHVLETLNACTNDTNISAVACQQDSSRTYQLTWSNTTVVKTFTCLGSKPLFL